MYMNSHKRIYQNERKQAEYGARISRVESLRPRPIAKSVDFFLCLCLSRHVPPAQIEEESYLASVTLSYLFTISFHTHNTHNYVLKHLLHCADPKYRLYGLCFLWFLWRKKKTRT